jgi:3-oxoacyl-[acyl-carrier-protein] synthase-3
MQAVIKNIEFSVPKKRVSNDELASTLDTSDEWIYSHTGIKNRHIAEPEQATSDLAYEACRKVLDASGMPAEKIDLILLATVTGDYIGFPSTASIVQDKIGAKNAAAMDIQAGCTGFIYALETARAFIAGNGAKNVLVVGAEIMSRIANWKDRDTCVLFGDGAGAALVCAEDSNDERGVLLSFLRSDGSGHKLLERTYGGTRFPKAPETEGHNGSCIRMDGRQVYNFAVKVISEGVLNLLESKGYGIKDLSYIVPHQANARIIEAAAKRSKIPMDKFYMNIDEYANTSAATIPIALSEMEKKGLIKRGDLILTYGFGAGLTYGGNLIRW